MGTRKAFSLVELLVVVAIIGTLSAMAVPVYKNYVIKARLASVQPVLSDIILKSKQYYARFGVYPSFQQMNMAYDVGNPNQTNPVPTNASQYYMPPYIAVMVTGGATGYTCPAGVLVSYVSNFNNGAFTDTDSNPDMVFLQYVFTPKNGADVTFCGYMYQSGGVPIDGDFIPGCLNAVSNPTAFDDFLNSC